MVKILYIYGVAAACDVTAAHDLTHFLSDCDETIILDVKLEIYAIIFHDKTLFHSLFNM